jgi:hypothetical protein
VSNAAQRNVMADLADAMQMQVQQATDLNPSIRGADWRLAVVASIDTDGTVTTTDNIIARRMSTYLTPIVGDVIVITSSGNGNWITYGRTAPASTAGTWQTLPLAGSWTAYGLPFLTPSYRINGDGTVSLAGLARAPGSTTGTSTVGTLPVGARPSAQIRATSMVAIASVGALDIKADGTVQIADYSGTATWAGLDNITFRIA